MKPVELTYYMDLWAGWKPGDEQPLLLSESPIMPRPSYVKKRIKVVVRLPMDLFDADEEVLATGTEEE